MTSRFGKTYSRKGGDGASKFDEVLSTKRGTLSTKWGDTKYKAKVGSKRGLGPKNDACPEVFKRPRAGGDEDPFGFDSDEESKPVSSRTDLCRDAHCFFSELNGTWSCVFLFHSHMFNSQNLFILAEFFSQTENALFHLVMSSCDNAGSAPPRF
uniref:WAPL cohesin release factor b n=1 Tax=Periophthalmus magnuspinnatus TaxID=409849 RepID=A0A3B4A1U7_9GOBI